MFGGGTVGFLNNLWNNLCIVEMLLCTKAMTSAHSLTQALRSSAIPCTYSVATSAIIV